MARPELAHRRQRDSRMLASYTHAGFLWDAGVYPVGGVLVTCLILNHLGRVYQRLNGVLDKAGLDAFCESQWAEFGWTTSCSGENHA